LSLEAVEILAGTIDLSLIPVNLLLLLVIGVLMTLQLVANQCPRTKPETTADSRPNPRTTDGSAYQATRRRAAEGANAGAFLAGGQRSTSATR
jgi:hypothetical protein